MGGSGVLAVPVMVAIRDAIGVMRERLTVQQKTITTDSHLGRAVTWTDLQVVWGQCYPLSGSERIQAASVGSHVAWRITVRYRGDLTPQMRLRWTPYQSTTTKTLEIQGIRPKDGCPEYLELDCGEVT